MIDEDGTAGPEGGIAAGGIAGILLAVLAALGLGAAGGWIGYGKLCRRGGGGVRRVTVREQAGSHSSGYSWQSDGDEGGSDDDYEPATSRLPRDEQPLRARDGDGSSVGGSVATVSQVNARGSRLDFAAGRHAWEGSLVERVEELAEGY